MDYYTDIAERMLKKLSNGKLEPETVDSVSKALEESIKEKVEDDKRHINEELAKHGKPLIP